MPADTPTRNTTEALRIGLTGGIASGKSLAADAFAELGVPIIDTDVIAREVVAPGQPALLDIAERFGPAVLQPDGTLDRAALRRKVFEHDTERAALEALLHPRIRAVALAEAASCDYPYLILVVPLLFETGFDELVDRTLVVDTSSATQTRRLLERDGGSEEEAGQIIASQMNSEARLAAADDILLNDGSAADLRKAVVAQHEYYLGLAAANA